MNAFRTFVFWVAMILLAVLMWRMASNVGSPKSGHEISYSEFMEQLSKDNIRGVTIETLPHAALVLGRLRNQQTDFRLTTARENIPELTKLLVEKKIVLHFREGSPRDITTILLNLAPILVFALLWIFMIRQMQKKGPPGPGSGQP